MIEVMIALAILAMLSLLTSQAMKSGITNKMTMESTLNRENNVLDALRVIHDDLNAALHHRDVLVKMYNEIVTPPEDEKAAAGNADSPKTNKKKKPQTPQAPPLPAPSQLTGFIGQTDSIFFTSTNHIRTIRDAKESDEAKIGYYLKSCRVEEGGNKKARSSNCLFRSESPYLDEDLSKVDSESVLVSDVTEFRLRYLGAGHEDYIDSWSSHGEKEQGMKDKFPDAVEVTLTIHNQSDKKDKPYSQTILVPLRFPNNE